MNRCTALTTAIVAAGLALTGCTGTTVKPNMTHQEVAKTYSVVCVGDITFTDELWKNYSIEAHRAMASQLIDAKVFSHVVDPAPTPLPAESLQISGHITEVEKGSAAARWIVGFGAGRAHITGEFELRDSSGNLIGTYSVRKTYAGGAGIGGAGFLDMDDLATKLGEAAADSLVTWTKTGKLSEQ